MTHRAIGTSISVCLLLVLTICLFVDTGHAVNGRTKGFSVDPPLFPSFLNAPPIPLWSDPRRIPDVMIEAENQYLVGWDKGNYLPGVEAYKAALREEIDPRLKWMAYWRIAEGYQRLQYYPEAMSYWKKAVESSIPLRWELKARAALAENLFQSGQPREAMGYFKDLADTRLPRGDRTWAYFRVCDCMVELNTNVNRVHTRYMKGVASRPKPQWIPPESLDNLTYFYLENNRTEEAVWALMTVLSLYKDPRKRPKRLDLLGETYVRQGKYVEAAFAFEKVIEEYPFSSEAKRATIRLSILQHMKSERPVVIGPGLKLGDLEDKMNPLYHEFTGDPAIQRDVLNLAVIFKQRGENKKAFYLLYNALVGFDETVITEKIRFELLDLIRMKIDMEVDSESYKDAIQDYVALAKWVPAVETDPEINLDIGISYEKTKNLEPAVDRYEFIGGLGPEQKEYVEATKGLIRVGGELEDSGFLEVAASVYKSIRDRGSDRPQYAEATKALFCVILKQGQSRKAVSLLNSIPENHMWTGVGKRLVDRLPEQNDPRYAKMVGNWLYEVGKGQISKQSLLSVAGFYIDQGEYEECADFLQEAIIGWMPDSEDLSENQEAWAMLGDALRKLGKKDESLEVYEQALKGDDWGFGEKLAAYRALQVGAESRKKTEVKAYLDRLLEEPEGNLWRELAGLIREKIEDSEETG